MGERRTDVPAEPERWRQIASWEGVYSIGTRGSVRRDCPGRSTYVGKLLKASPVGGGYLAVTLRSGGRVAKVKVHVLVAATYLRQPGPGEEVRHLDGDRHNNCVENLQWGSRGANQRDSVVHGTHNQARKTHCPRGHAYDGTNTILTKARRRVCRTCNRAANARRRATRKMATS